MDICANCGLLISTANVPLAAAGAAGNRSASDAVAGAPRGVVTCRLCETSKHVERVALPFVFKYLVSELAAMNIRCSVDVA